MGRIEPGGRGGGGAESEKGIPTPSPTHRSRCSTAGSALMGR